MGRPQGLATTGRRMMTQLVSRSEEAEWRFWAVRLQRRARRSPAEHRGSVPRCPGRCRHSLRRRCRPSRREAQGAQECRCSSQRGTHPSGQHCPERDQGRVMRVPSWLPVKQAAWRPVPDNGPSSVRGRSSCAGEAGGQPFDGRSPRSTSRYARMLRRRRAVTGLGPILIAARVASLSALSAGPEESLDTGGHVAVARDVPRVPLPQTRAGRLVRLRQPHQVALAVPLVRGLVRLCPQLEEARCS